MTGFWHTLRNQIDAQQRFAQFVINSVWAFILIIVTALVARYCKRWAKRMLLRAHVQPNVVQLLGNAVTIGCVLVGAAFVLSVYGVPPTAVITSISLATAGIVLAFQDVLKNLIAGVYLLVERPFTIGDRIKVRDAEGTVEGVDIRTTALKTDAGTIVLVPNNLIFTEIVSNRSASGIGHVLLTLTNVNATPDEATAKVRETLKDLATIATTPPPRVSILATQEGKAEMQVEFWYRGISDPTAEAIMMLDAQFPGARITSAA
jgi:small-conductance mechanosensitive channel